MLINSLHAKNFRKYHKLEIDDIPNNGIITVAGSNESGKTSIGEAVCFALFGRTFSLGQEQLHKLVSWSKKLAEVTLTFTSGNGDKYEIWRSVDSEGATQAKLHKSTSNADEENNTLEDNETVTEALKKLLGFGYDAFANSFYLAQRELTSPDPHSAAIKQMAGIGAYAEISDEFELSNKRNEEVILELQPKIDATQRELDEINLDENWLPALVDAEETLVGEKQQREVFSAELTEKGEQYNNHFGEFHDTKKMWGFWGFLNKIMIPIALILALLWVTNTYFKDAFSNFLTESLSGKNLEAVSMITEKWLLPALVIAVLAYFVSLFLRKKASTKMNLLDAEAQGLSVSFNKGHRYVTTLVETMLPESVVQMLHDRDKDPSTLQVLPPREQFNNLTNLSDNAPGYRADIEEITSAVSRLTDALSKQDSEIEELSGDIANDIVVEKERSDAAGELRSSMLGLQKIVDKSKYNIDKQIISIGLLQRAAGDLVEQFNQNIAVISANTLPKFTEDRYSKIKIAADFVVQIHSDDKQDYMDFDEISSGTQRQVMLALRVAMSEELARNTGNEKQFIFLDEPFAFFDQNRTRSTLEALPEVSEVISQVWISAQEFPTDVKVNKAINCPLDSTELLV